MKPITRALASKRSKPTKMIQAYIGGPTIDDVLYAYSLHMPIIVRSEANERCHWRVKAKRVREQRRAVMQFLLSGMRAQGYPPLPPTPTVITLRRFGRKLDGDNLVIAFKGVRDSVAEWLAIDDGDDRLEWRYEQTAQSLQGISISITANMAATK